MMGGYDGRCRPSPGPPRHSQIPRTCRPVGGGGGQQGSQAGQPAGGDSNAGEKGGGGAVTSESGDGSDETHGKHNTVYELVQQADCFKIWFQGLGLRQLFNTATIRIKFL